MTSRPTSSDVVRTAAEAAASVRPPLLILDDLERYFDAQGLGEGEIRWSRIGDGQSNLTYLIERGADAFILRRGPRPPYPPSAHDMVREARIQSAVRSVGFPAPSILAVCEDPGVIGVPFYVMDVVNGIVLTDEIPASLADPPSRRATGFAAVDALADLHSLDASAPPLSRLGRPDGYLARQVRRFSAVWTEVARRDVPTVQELAWRLSATLPDTRRTTLVHGDFRLGNIMFDPASPARVAAVLDWELATLGDPLADLGYLLATYSVPTSPALPIELTPITREPGYPGRSELAERYGAIMDVDLDALAWYQALALWKSAIFCEAIYSRWLQGERPGDGFAPRLERGVPAMLEEARRFLDEG